MTAYRWLAAAAILFTFVQIVLGALTRLTGSGLACPDWPLCYGLLFPTPAKLAALPAVDFTYFQVMLEWSHRFNAAALVAPLILGLVMLGVSLIRTRPQLNWLAGLAISLLLIQGGLGRFTVLDRNSPWSVAVHLSVALVFLGVLIWAYRAARPEPPVLIPAARRLVVGGAAVLVLATMASGAMMAKSGATLACGGWPLCDGAWIPDLSDGAVRLHFCHRLLAIATALVVVAAAWRLHPMRPAAAVIGIQVLVGAGVVVAFAGDSLAGQVAAGAIHQAIGVVLFATLIGVLWPPLVASDAGA